MGKSNMTSVYLSLGSNIGDSSEILQKAIDAIRRLDDVEHVISSPFYHTTPVNMKTTRSFVNSVVQLRTVLSAHRLLSALQGVENWIGKEPKAKNEDRLIDIDILFFGEEYHKDKDLEIPHPHWKQRLFVLAPLADLTDRIRVRTSAKQQRLTTIDIPKLLKGFQNTHNERVVPMAVCGSQ